MAVSTLRHHDIAPSLKVDQCKVHCPYCLIGYVIVDAVHQGGTVTQANVAPRQCPKCNSFFRLAWQITFYGIREEGH